MESLHSKDYLRFIEVMVELRRELSVTQVELAQRIRKPQSYVSKSERRERRIDVVEFINIVRALGADPSQVMKRIEKRLSK